MENEKNCCKKKKVVAFDLVSAQPSVDARFHGGGEYIKAVFEALVNKHHLIDAEIIALYSEKRFIDGWLKKLIEDKSVKSVNLNSVHEIVKTLEKEGIHYDVLYTGGDRSISDSLPQGSRLICTIHDMRDFEEPVDIYSFLYYGRIDQKMKQIGKLMFRDYLKKRNLKKYKNFVAKSDQIFCDSEHARWVLTTYIPESSNKVLGAFYAPSKHFENKVTENVTGDSGYILLVSSNRWIKNVYRAVKAIDHLYDEHLLYVRSVVVGGMPKGIRRRIKHMEMFDVLPYVEADALENLYASCGLFVYPTLNEGFGMPPLEAMRYGKTCVISALCSLTELYSECAYLVNPYSIEEMASHILMALKKPIEKDIIEKTYLKIVDRQNKDLDKMVDIIVG